MKNIIVGAVLACVSAVAGAQGYVGAVAALSNYRIDCPNSIKCDKGGFAGKVYFGQDFQPSSVISLGAMKVGSFEFGFVNFGRSNSAAVDLLPSQTEDALNGNEPLVYGTFGKTYIAHALTAAMVGRIPLAGALNGVARVGVAYVSTTLKQSTNAASNGSVTEAKLKPYVGFGIEYEIANLVTVTGGVDITQYQAGGNKGTLTLLGIGAQKGF